MIEIIILAIIFIIVIITIIATSLYYFYFISYKKRSLIDYLSVNHLLDDKCKEVVNILEPHLPRHVSLIVLQDDIMFNNTILPHYKGYAFIPLSNVINLATLYNQCEIFNHVDTFIRNNVYMFWRECFLGN